MSKKRRDTKLSAYIKKVLGRSAPLEWQDSLAMAGGDPGKTNAEVIAEHVVKEARDNKERWAIELCFDRTEGKPIQAVKADDGDRSTEERIDDVTTAHLNDLARFALQPVASGAGGEAVAADEHAPRAGEGSAGAARNPLDVSEDGDSDSEDA